MLEWLNIPTSWFPHLCVVTKNWDLVTDILKLAGDSGRKLEEIARSFYLFGDIIFDLKEANIHVP